MLALVIGVSLAFAAPPVPTAVERWGQWELELDGPMTGNPFVDVEIDATFSLSSRSEKYVRGCARAGVWKTTPTLVYACL